MQKPKMSLLDWASSGPVFAFIDRDGVINTRFPGTYIRSPEEFHWRPGSIKALNKICSHASYTTIVTNQAGIAKGLMTEEDLASVHNKMLTELSNTGHIPNLVLHCPHLATTHCACRKPAPGMAFQAVISNPSIIFHRSVIIGDSLSDIAFGRALGMKTILVATKIDEYDPKNLGGIDAMVFSLEEAVDRLFH